MITKNVSLYLGDRFPVRIPVSQYDTMWQFVFSIVNNSQPWQIPTGATAVLNGKKPDGNAFAFAGTIADNKVTVDADVQMTACAGDTICELSILSDGLTVGTANFVLAVEAAPNSTGATPSASAVDAYGAIISGELDTYFEQHPEMIEGKGLSEPIRLAILDCFQHVVWVDEQGSDYYNALYALLMNKELLSITVVFDQGTAVIIDSDTLDSLRQYLTVTANYDDGTSSVVTTYTLDGELTTGTSTITVEYGGKTATFDVSVSGLPNTYQKVEYIEGTGTQYINTGYVPNLNTEIELVFKNNYTASTLPSPSPTPYGIKNDTTNNWIGLYHYTDNLKGSFVAFGTKHDVRWDYNTDTAFQSVKHTKDGIWVNGESSLVYTGATFPTDSLPLYMFCRNGNGNAERFCKTSISSFIISENEERIAYFVACYRKSDNVIGMYDIISNNFYTNQGSGIFGKGSDI